MGSVDGAPYSSSRSSGAWDAAVSRLRLSRQLSPFISRMWTWWVSRSSSAPVSRSEPKTSVHSSKGSSCLNGQGVRGGGFHG